MATAATVKAKTAAGIDSDPETVGSRFKVFRTVAAIPLSLVFFL